MDTTSCCCNWSEPVQCLTLPFVAQRNAPGDVFQRQVEFRREQFQVERARVRLARSGSCKKISTGHRLVAARLLFQRDQNAVLLAPGPDAVLVDEGEPEIARPWAASDASRRLSPGNISSRACVSMTPVVGNDRGEGDVVDAGGQQLGRLVAFEFQAAAGTPAPRGDRRNWPRPVGKSFCSARGMLCHSAGCSASGSVVHAHLQAAGRIAR